MKVKFVSKIELKTRPGTKPRPVIKPRPKTYVFDGKLWKYKSNSGWHFVTLPKSLSKKIRKIHGSSEEGWGRLKTIARIGKTEWNTAIWFDSKFQSYLLPVKASIRKTESLAAGVVVAVKLLFRESHF